MLLVAALWAVAIIVLGVLLANTEAFSDCVHGRSELPRYSGLREQGGLLDGALVRAATRARLSYVCAWNVADRSNGAILALAMLALGVFAFALWRTMVRQWRAVVGLWEVGTDAAHQIERVAAAAQQAAAAAQQTAAAAEQSAIAASRSADILAQTERAVIGSIYVDDNVREEEARLQEAAQSAQEGAAAPLGALRLQVEYRLKNYGKTPAFLREVEHDIVIAEALPDSRAFPANPNPLSERVLSGEGGETAVIACERTFEDGPSGGGLEGLIDGTKSVWLVARVGYRDIAGNDHEHGFAYRYDPQRRRFAPVEHPRYSRDT